MACRRASSSSVSSFAKADALATRRANWSTFTDAANSGPLSPGKMGVKGYNYGGTLSTDIQQRKAKAAGPSLVDGGQPKVEGVSGPNVRQCTHWEIQRRLGDSAL